MKNLMHEIVFYNALTFVGWLLFGGSMITFWLSFSTSALVSELIKFTFGRSSKNRSGMRKYALVGVFLSLLILSLGFKNKFSETSKEKQGTYKKCSPPNRDGYCACRTFDRACIWAILKNGAEVHRVEFPKEWNVVSVGIFENSQAQIVGRSPQSRNQVIGYLTVDGQIIEETE